VCVRCGERELVTPRVEVLHGAIARSLSRQDGPLAPEAVRYLRKWLNLTIHQFARVMGVRGETVCRWERANGSSRLPPPTERLLRLLVALHESADAYPLDLLSGTRPARAAPIVLVSPDWREAAAEKSDPL
jgi:DNA-binding transcriptional regulator YiaG